MARTLAMIGRNVRMVTNIFFITLIIYYNKEPDL